MKKDIAPFGNYKDDDIQRALTWFLGFINAADWNQRVEKIESHIESIVRPYRSRYEAPIPQPVSIPFDKIAWYIYLAYTALHEPLKYEPTQGARVLPLFKRIGADLDLLKGVKGVNDRVEKMINRPKNQPDSTLFELLVAMIWKRNGSTFLEFIGEAPPEKRPDIHAINKSDEWFIECKRLNKSSEYSKKEREKWLTMWSKFMPFLTDHNISAIFDMVFHVELETLPDDFLLEQLSWKLQIIQLPCEIISNDIWDVAAKPIDYETIDSHLSKYRVKYPGDQFNELIGGGRDPNRGFTSVFEGKFVRTTPGMGNNIFLEKIVFASCAFWHCDAERSIERKARDVRKHLSKSIEQLPFSQKGVVHIALETLDGAVVELERFMRILNSISTFDALGKDLQWVFCHLFQSYAPPNDCWVFDETVYKFCQNKVNISNPIEMSSAVIPDENGLDDEMHWLRDPP